MTDRAELPPPADAAATVDALSAWSPAFKRYLAREPDLDAVLRDATLLAAGVAVEPPCPPIGPARDVVVAGLRAARRRAFLVGFLAEQWSDDPAVSFAWWTACADRWLRAAFDAAVAVAAAPLGVGPEALAASCPFTVLGLGKLGALELNPSSDVDLIVAYAADEPPGWPIRTDPHAFYGRVVRDAAAWLSEATADGFCLRVDYDLRPEGRTGPLVNSVDALLAYYEQFGTALDRMAMTRARPVAGDPVLGARLVGALQPFVYPRSVVGGALSLLASVLGRLRTKRPDGEVFDLKTGRGGIRDVELFVAAHQLLYGGRVEALHDTRTLAVIEATRVHGLVSRRDATVLADSYRFLRRLEHLVQYREDRQTQALALAPDSMASLATVLRRGATGASLTQALRSTRLRVARLADRLFGLAGEAGSADAVGVMLDPGAGEGDREAAARDLRFADPDATLAALARMRAAPSSPTHPRNQGRFPGFEAAMVRAVTRTTWPDGSLEFLVRLARNARAVPLFEACLSDPRVLESLAQVGGASPVAAAALARDPGAAVEQSITGFAGDLPDRDAVLTEALADVALRPFDEAGDRLSAFRSRHLLDVILADLHGADVAAVGEALADIADACIRAALEAVGLRARGLAVLALGRLGGREMGYLSDLDVVLVHGGGGAEAMGPAVQRALTLLTTRGVAGPMYALDFRLRPSGNQGPLLVDANEYASWHETSASAPERLGAALCRAVGGDLELGGAVAARVRRAGAAGLRDAGSLTEVLAMRQRQRAAVAAAAGAPPGDAGAFDPKTAAGGLWDIETVSHLRAARGAEDAVAVPTGTLALLAHLQATEAARRPDLAVLDRAARFLLRLANRSHLVLDRSISRVPPAGPSADRLARSLGFGDDRPTEAMWAACRATLKDSQRACDRLLDDMRGGR